MEVVRVKNHVILAQVIERTAKRIGCRVLEGMNDTTDVRFRINYVVYTRAKPNERRSDFGYVVSGRVAMVKYPSISIFVEDRRRDDPRFVFFTEF